jgi:mono/diheme cytochrome c family protein
MKTVKLGLIFLAIAIFSLACANNQTQTNKTENETKPNTANTQPTAPADELASAKKIYSESCVKCHKEDGSGGQIQGDDGKFNVTSFKSEKAMKHDEAKMYDYIANGDDEMPAFKSRLSEQQMKDLVKFIRKDFQGR